jgi:quinoprotein glucose dehydrogenase
MPGMKYSSILFIVLLMTSCHNRQDYSGWTKYKGSSENIHYSSLAQIDTVNVQHLQLAWEYHTGDADTASHSQIQCNPIIVNGILYGTSPKMKLFAVDAATGKEKWVFNPFDTLTGNKKKLSSLNSCRGVTFWSDGKEDERIFYTAGDELYAINAGTGKPVTSFGSAGSIDLHSGLDREVPDLFVTSTSPPIVYKDMLIVGTRVDEGPAAAPGHIRAFNARTGKREWIFHTIPHPGEPGFETWDDSTAYTFIGGANAWSGFSLDEKRGIVFACTGSASYDWYGGKRTGNGLYSDCVLALDANTGKLIWHFQDIHHDVWDRDFSSPPALVSVEKNGQSMDAVAVTTKTGFIFLFERETGKPVYDIAEKPVPQSSELIGEKLSPTQPIPSFPAPFMRQLFTEKDINPLLPDSSFQEIKKRWASYKHDNMFNPPSLQGTIEFPGLDGGGEWGGPSYDPETKILYVNANEMAWVIQSIPIKEKTDSVENYGKAGQRLFTTNCMQCHGADRKGTGNFPTLIGADKKYTPGAFDSLLQTGRRMMPALRQLDPEERKAIASYVLNQKTVQQKTFIAKKKIVDEHLRMPYTIAGYNKFLTKEGLPAISPPWGTLNAIDLKTGNYIWKKTLGNDTAFKNSNEPTGTENYGASVVTAGGLLFIAATKDGKLRAFNKRDGSLLWETALPAPGFATPAVFAQNGKQFVVIACGGGKMNTLSGDSYVAYALP